MTRRSFLRLTAGGLAGLPFLLQACGGSAAPANSAPASSPAQASAAPASGPAAASAAAKPSVAASPPASGAAPASAGASGATATAGGVKLPTYVPFAGGPKPDFPGSSDGVVLPAYLTYPKDQPKTVPQPFGKGEDVNTMMSTTQAVPTPVDQNPAWQQVNKEMGVNFKMTPAQIADYPVKLNATIAGGQLPDLMSISTGTIVANLPGFLDALCQDLTPFLSGDAIKDYPNLANIPPYAWRNCIFNGKIYCVPAVRTGITGPVQFAKGKLLDSVGGINFKDKDDFMRAMKALTVNNQQWGIGFTSGQTNGVPSPAGFFTRVFGSPNNWRNDNGKLTKNFETPEFKAAIDYVSQLWKAGVVWPDSPSATVNQAGTTFYSGKYGLWENGFIIGDTVWNRANQQDPNFKLEAV
ncbi:MAG TPA: extracellular solute-binding protein, partial [Chloroflexota bacterium]|nr:extracellular solute-binding protein [Chloroflexota bacterium]